MESILKFLVDNWQFISSGILTILSIIILILKKRPLSLDEFQSCLDDMYRNLPYFVQLAEDNVDSGPVAKKQFVLAKCQTFIEGKLHRDLTTKEATKVASCATWCIEEILRCPTKKGGYGREQD